MDAWLLSASALSAEAIAQASDRESLIREWNEWEDGPFVNGFYTINILLRWAMDAMVLCMVDAKW